MDDNSVEPAQVKNNPVQTWAPLYMHRGIGFPWEAVKSRQDQYLFNRAVTPASYVTITCVVQGYWTGGHCRIKRITLKDMDIFPPSFYVMHASLY